MAAKKGNGQKADIVIADLGQPNSEPQWNFFLSKAKYTCYGGARGGGKSWSTQRKSILLAFEYPGIKILIIRREYSDMENSIIDPILALLPPQVHSYNKTEHRINFTNGSVIKFGNMPGYGAAVMGRYQGQEHDVLFLEEATYIRTKSSAQYRKEQTSFGFTGFPDCRPRQSMGFKRPRVRISTLGPKIQSSISCSGFFFVCRDPNDKMQMSSGHLLDAGLSASTPWCTELRHLDQKKH